MKKALIIIILAASAVLTGCKKEQVNGSSPEGTGLLSLNLSGKDNGYVVKSGEDIDVSGFTVKVTGLNGAYSQEWIYADMPPVLELSSGDYTISATSPVTADSEWGEPVYAGSKDFKIAVGSTTTLDVECKVSNIKVSIKLSDDFLAEIVDFEVTVVEDIQDEKKKFLVWDNDDIIAGQAGFFSVVPLKVTVQGTRWDDNESNPSRVSYTVKISNVEPACHYVLNLDANTTGNAGANITVSPELTDKVENIDVPGLVETPVEGGDDTPSEDNPTDEPESPAITMEWDANPDFKPMDISSSMDVVIKISAPAGIKTFNVNVESAALNTILTDLDLINPGADLAAVAEMILNGQTLQDATEVTLDLSSLVPMIAGLGPAPDTDHIFTLSMSDNDGNDFEKKVVFHYTGTAE